MFGMGGRDAEAGVTFLLLLTSTEMFSIAFSTILLRLVYLIDVL